MDLHLVQHDAPSYGLVVRPSTRPIAPVLFSSSPASDLRNCLVADLRLALLLDILEVHRYQHSVTSLHRTTPRSRHVPRIGLLRRRLVFSAPTPPASTVPAGKPSPRDLPTMADQHEVDLDSIIDRLLEVRGSRPGKQVQLLEAEIRYLCTKAREIFISQPILLELEAPIKVRIFLILFPLHHQQPR